MAWEISNFEPVYVDDDWGDDNMCPVSCEECGCRFDDNGEECYWARESEEEERR